MGTSGGRRASPPKLLGSPRLWVPVEFHPPRLSSSEVREEFMAQLVVVEG